MAKQVCCLSVPPPTQGVNFKEPQVPTHRIFHLGATLTLLAAVHELASVDALGGDEQLRPLLKTVRIPEDHLGKGRAAARVVDDVLRAEAA